MYTSRLISYFAEMDKYTFKGVDYYICDMDARGSFRDAAAVNRVISEELAGGNYTDVVLFSHGYNVKREKDGSLDLCNDVIPNMDAKRPADRRCLYIAIKWPSFISTIFDGNNKNPKKLVKELIRMVGEGIGESGALSGVMTRSLSKHAENNLATLQEEADLFLADAPDTDDEETHADGNIGSAVPSTSVITKPSPVHTAASNGNSAGDGDLPPKLCGSIANLINELNKQSEQDDGDDTCLLDDREGRYMNVTAERVRKRFKYIRAKNVNPSAAKPEEPGKTQVDSRSLTIIGTLLALKKAWDFAHTLNDFFLGTFERRACVIGSVGVHKLLHEMMDVTTSDVRFHLFGHSLGAHVITAAAIGRGPPKQLQRKIHSLVIAQGACSADCFGVGGPYRPLVSTLAPIAGPILGTVFYGDVPLLSYNLFYPKPLGRFGFDKNVSPFDFKQITVKSQEYPSFNFKKRTCYSLLAEGIVTEHGDVGDLELMNLFWQAATMKMNAKDYEMTDNEKLPYGFWNDFDVRTEKNVPPAKSGCSLM